MPDIIATQRRLTSWFIHMGPPSEIVLVPTSKVATPGKGVKTTEGTPRDSQLFKKIFTGGDGLRTDQDGVKHTFDMVLVGLWDCEAAIGDVWEDSDGQKYIIHSEYPNNHYERKFGVYSVGNQPKDG